ncbi:hypothetical protein FB45DRAFT_876955 [Roridomyces roridus]|uniref:Uncharacterized protein n=1 Tax=Roridomyces roridus TaxID=1738132 RepID=A0AAD7F8F7_9AGAR|nr:hypothetical protein FB45DRAFT_876955 [Roridomyces roridus]
MPPKGRFSGAERQATYRRTHRDEVLAQDRIHAARRRAKTRSNPASDAASKTQANRYAAGYRATNAAALARKEMIRRCRKSIDKIGYDAWLQTWRRRHPGEAPPSELGYTEDHPPPASIVVNRDDGNEYDNLEMFAQSRLSRTKLERWTRRREARRVRDLEELEWAQDTAALDAVLVGNAPDGLQGGVDGGNYFLPATASKARMQKTSPLPPSLTTMLLGTEAYNIFFHGAMPSRPVCTPRFYASNEYDPHRDSLYPVAIGEHIGVYTNVDLARQQTDGFPDSQMRSCKGWAGPKGAKIVWIDLCLKYHTHQCPTPTLPDGFFASSPIPGESIAVPPAPISIPAPPPPTIAVGASYDMTCHEVPSSPFETPSSPCPSLVDLPNVSDDERGYDERYAELGAGYKRRYAAAIQSAGLKLEFVATESATPSPHICPRCPPPLVRAERKELSTDISSQLSAMSSRSHSRTSSGSSSSSFSNISSMPDVSPELFASLSQSTMVAPACSPAALPSVLPAVGFDDIRLLLGDADPSEGELAVLQSRLDLHSAPRSNAPLLYAVVGVRGRLFEYRSQAIAAASRRSLFKPVVVGNNHYDKLLDLSFWTPGADGGNF